MSFQKEIRFTKKYQFQIFKWQQKIKFLDKNNFPLSGLEAVQRHGRARVGDRTLIDALHPAIEKLRNSIESVSNRTESLESVLEAASSEADHGANATTSMKASAGRASYVHESELKQPDPGARAVAIIFKAVLDAAKS
jgi:dihydroxyacetone kinase